MGARFLQIPGLEYGDAVIVGGHEKDRAHDTGNVYRGRASWCAGIPETEFSGMGDRVIVGTYRREFTRRLRPLECAFLAPDIVEAIVDGRQPEGLTWKKLTRHVPMNWVEQRKRLGFPPSSVDVN
jgi:hypothetical protein